jgi:CDP-diacylglycerol pyrophosphatase
LIVAAFVLLNRRNTLWEVVHYVCVPGESRNRDSKPCLQVDLNEGIEKGFAILRDPKGDTHFLLVPTTRISGIESPILLGPDATNYFASAWEARTYVNEALHGSLPSGAIGLAVNSTKSRSQDQLHIHIDCVRTNVFEALHKNEQQLGDTWVPFKRAFFRHPYSAIWVSGEHLGSHNPFQILAERLPGARQDMGNRTLVVIGLTRADGTKGFVILTDAANKQRNDSGYGEELLDHSCRMGRMSG